MGRCGGGIGLQEVTVAQVAGGLAVWREEPVSAGFVDGRAAAQRRLELADVGVGTAEAPRPPGLPRLVALYMGGS